MTGQIKYVVRDIPVQADEMPWLLWLSFQNILPVPDMKGRKFVNEAQKPKKYFKQNLHTTKKYLSSGPLLYY